MLLDLALGLLLAMTDSCRCEKALAATIRGFCDNLNYNISLSFIDARYRYSIQARGRANTAPGKGVDQRRVDA